MKFTLGCTTRPYRNLSFSEACEHIAAAGYTDVAVFRHQGSVPVDSRSTSAQVSETRRAAEDVGLRPSLLLGTTHLGTGLEEAVADYCRLIDNTAALGAHWLLDCGINDASLFGAYLELMRRCTPHAEDAGVAITMKPHGGISLTPDDLLRVHGAVNHPAFGVCYDPGNIIYYTQGERRPETNVERVISATSVFIVKDCTVTEGTPDVNVTPGDGWVDFPRILRAFVDGGFAGPLYLECVGSNDPVSVDRDIAFSLGFVRGILESAVSR